MTIGGLFARLFEVNADLWDAEDEIRRDDYAHATGAQKRHIDKLNAERNRLIEAIDLEIAELWKR